MRSRPFLFRLGLAALGMHVFCLIAGIGVGWWIRTWPVRFETVLGKSRAHRLTLGYARLLDALYPQDSDGDGISDLVEILLHKDPRNPGFHWAPVAGYITPASLKLK